MRLAMKASLESAQLDEKAKQKELRKAKKEAKRARKAELAPRIAALREARAGQSTTCASLPPELLANIVENAFPNNHNQHCDTWNGSWLGSLLLMGCTSPSFPTVNSNKVRSSAGSLHLISEVNPKIYLTNSSFNSNW